MIDIVTKSGKRIGRISDSMDQDDTLVIDGKEVSLTDVYANENIRMAFNDQVKELKDDSSEDSDTE